MATTRASSKSRARRRSAGASRSSRTSTRAAAKVNRRAPALEIRRPAIVGTGVPRLEGADKVTGAARYVDDLVVPGVLHGFTVRSTVPHGRIRRIELDPAFDWSGVVVCDHRDVPGVNAIALIEHDQPLLAHDVIRHADEPVALVAHADRERALAARDHVRVEVEPLAPVLTIEDSLARRQLLYGDDNVFKHILIERGDLARRRSPMPSVIVEGEYRLRPPGAALHREQRHDRRAHDAGRHHRARLAAVPVLRAQGADARCSACRAEKVRVIQTVTGGGFGGKEEYPSVIAAHAALLAWKSGTPVKIVYDRAGGHRRHHQAASGRRAVAHRA